MMLESVVGIELDKLDADMIKVLAWQRIQQLFPSKAPSTPTPVTTAASPKTPSLLPNSKFRLCHSVVETPHAAVGMDLKLKLLSTGQKKVQARAVFYPLTGRGGAVNMCYRTLYIGSGETWNCHGNLQNLCWLNFYPYFEQLQFSYSASTHLYFVSPDTCRLVRLGWGVTVTLNVGLQYNFLFSEGADMDVCLTNYGHCNYISGKHACIFYDEVCLFLVQLFP